jgi:hypothetical protein
MEDRRRGLEGEIEETMDDVDMKIGWSVVIFFRFER